MKHYGQLKIAIDPLVIIYYMGLPTDLIAYAILIKSIIDSENFYGRPVTFSLGKTKDGDRVIKLVRK